MKKRTLWDWTKIVHDLKTELAEAKDLIEKWKGTCQKLHKENKELRKVKHER